jgi:hypothetical protein
MASNGHTYDPVQDFLAQTGLDIKALDAGELALLQTLSRHEVDALVSIDNKGKQMQPIKRVGSSGF